MAVSTAPGLGASARTGRSARTEAGVDVVIVIASIPQGLRAARRMHPDRPVTLIVMISVLPPGAATQGRRARRAAAKVPWRG
jgi:hypothetical protein